MRALVIPALLCLAAAPAFGQSVTHVESVRTTYDVVKGYVTDAAEAMPEENYSFHPNPEMPEVRTFAQLVGHIANANYMFCSSALSDEDPNASDYEELTEKSALVEAVTESFAYCDDAYAMSEDQAAETTEFFTGPTTRLGVLSLNVAHDYEHYGNIVTYMRINGLVPPSSME